MGFFSVFLENPKTPINVGHALRAARVFGAAYVSYTGQRFKGAPTDVYKASLELPLFHVESFSSKDLPRDCVPVAVELVNGAIDLFDYEHPRSAVYIFGAEDGGVQAATLRQCRDVVRIPSRGCLNLVAAVNVVCYDRAAKEAKKVKA